MTQKSHAASMKIDVSIDLELKGLVALFDYLVREPVFDRANLKFVLLHVKLARLELNYLLEQRRELE